MKPFLAVAAALLAGAACAQPYRNVDNRPFATRSNGPQSAILVPLTGREATPAAVREKIAETVRAELLALDAAVSRYHSESVRLGLCPPNLPFIIPRVVLLQRPGEVAGRGGVSASASLRGGDLVLAFPPVGNDPGPFHPLYQQLLVDTFAAAKPVMDALFGAPFQGGTLEVFNMDDAIGDRDAVSGGVYLPDGGAGTPAIWFPVYLSPEAAAINFIHVLYLAYIGPAQFDYDAWNEGFARAATMQTARLGALPSGLDPDSIDDVLISSYDISARYSWYNQPPLGNNRFIAPNLRNLPLPAGGSLGGLYLMRYRQAGTVWAKVLKEYPGFFSTFLPQYYLNPGISGDIPALVALSQTTMDTLAGGPNATIEGRLFADWHRRQYILDTSVTRGRKVFVEAIPITFGLSGSDFGVFAFWASYFETIDQDGNEQLLSGTSFPLYWDADFLRMFPSAQVDRMDIAAGFGSVTPNLFDLFGTGGNTEWYKATVEIPVADVIGRAVVPAGAIATAQDPARKNFYGTVMGFDGDDATGNPDITGTVRLTFLDPPAQAAVIAPLRNGAFSAMVPDPGFSRPRRIMIEVLREISGVPEPPMHTEFVNTWGPELGLDIRLSDEGVFSPPGGLAGGVQMVGFPVRPYDTDMSAVLGLPPNQTLVARWQQHRFRYGLWPSLSPFHWGRGYFVRMPAADPGFSVFGRTPGPQPVSVPLQVGWNQIVNPFDTLLTVGDITVQRGAELEKTYSDAITEGWIGGEMFEFVPGAPDPFSGLPEGGTMSPVISFQPGRALFVRALVPEGITFTFRPFVVAGAHGGSSSGSLRLNWLGVLTFSGLDVEESRIEVGQAFGATRGYDVGLDALLPPAWGGALQAQLDGAEPAYRDIRAPGWPIWEIRLTGLRPGAVYELQFTVPVRNRRTPRFILQDRESRRAGFLRPGRTYSFTARSAEHRFRLAAVFGSGGSGW
ncbi:MAG: hypothetical protein IH851_02465 [Armatimonadetes bacterium]|nr:hypothetical protein [Armatimonadota bacterium]